MNPKKNITDIHTHGIAGFDTNTFSEADILKMAEIQGSRGVSQIIPTVYTSSIETMRSNMLAIKKAMDVQRAGPRGTAAEIGGIHLEGPFLNPSMCGALDAGTFLVPDEYSLKQLLDGFEDIVKIMTIAPELENARQIIRRISDAGIIASMGHSDATYTGAEEGFNSGARGITHLFNAMRGMHHREPGLAGFGLMNSEVHVEVIADPFHLDMRLIEFVFRVKNPERVIIVSDTVKTSGTAPAPGGLRDHQNRLAGGSVTVAEAVERLTAAGLDGSAVMRAAAENPRRYLQYSTA